MTSLLFECQIQTLHFIVLLLNNNLFKLVHLMIFRSLAHGAGVGEREVRHQVLRLRSERDGRRHRWVLDNLVNADIDANDL